MIEDMLTKYWSHSIHLFSNFKQKIYSKVSINLSKVAALEPVMVSFSETLSKISNIAGKYAFTVFMASIPKFHLISLKIFNVFGPLSSEKDFVIYSKTEKLFGEARIKLCNELRTPNIFFTCLDISTRHKFKMCA